MVVKTLILKLITQKLSCVCNSSTEGPSYVMDEYGIRDL